MSSFLFSASLSFAESASDRQPPHELFSASLVTGLYQLDPQHSNEACFITGKAKQNEYVEITGTSDEIVLQSYRSKDGRSGFGQIFVDFSRINRPFRPHEYGTADEVANKPFSIYYQRELKLLWAKDSLFFVPGRSNTKEAMLVLNLDGSLSFRNYFLGEKCRLVRVQE